MQAIELVAHIWSIPDAAASLFTEARKLLAWQAIDEEESDRLDDAQRHQLAQSLKKSERDLREAVWRTYKTITFDAYHCSFQDQGPPVASPTPSA